MLKIFFLVKMLKKKKSVWSLKGTVFWLLDLGEALCWDFSFMGPLRPDIPVFFSPFLYVNNRRTCSGTILRVWTKLYCVSSAHHTGVCALTHTSTPFTGSRSVVPFCASTVLGLFRDMCCRDQSLQVKISFKSLEVLAQNGLITLLFAGE